MIRILVMLLIILEDGTSISTKREMSVSASVPVEMRCGMAGMQMYAEELVNRGFLNGNFRGKWECQELVLDAPA